MNPLRAKSMDAQPRPGPRRAAVRDDTILTMTTGIAKGDEGAFNRFYDAYFPRIHRYLLVLAGGREEMVKDAVQDTMFRVIRYAKSFDGEAGFWNWLRKVSKTALIDQARRRKRSLTISSLPEVNEKEGSIVLLEHLSFGLKKLERKDRDLIEAKYLQNKSYEDLAREYHLSPRAVESRLGRIRKKLKALILERMKDE